MKHLCTIGKLQHSGALHAFYFATLKTHVPLPNAQDMRFRRWHETPYLSLAGTQAR